MQHANAMQPSLFDQQQEQAQEIQRPEPTRQQLLDSLERLFQTTEEQCMLPVLVIDRHTTHGVTTATSRTERLCPGYSKRQRASEREIAYMIMHIYIVVITSALEVFQLRARPDRALVRECVDIAASWLHFHPQSEEATR